MKNFSIGRVLALPIVMVLFFTSCKRYSSDFGDTNLDPNATTVPIPSALLTNVQAGLGGYASSVRGGLYCQYFSETQYSDASLYSIPQIAFESEYSGSLYDLQNIINLNSSNNMTQVARILKAFIFSTLADRWGDVPYSQALTGTNKTPKFDSQQEVYAGCLKELKEAVASFDANSAISGDIIYSGDVAKWKKMANTLRMRLAIQLSKRTAGTLLATAVDPKAEFAAALANAGGTITDNADNFTLKYPGGVYRSPWYELYNGRKDYGQSETMTNLMMSLSDGRQAAYGSSNLGVPYGRVRDFVDAWCGANPTWSRILNDSYREATSSVAIITASETHLLRAEAADRGWTTENMNQLYQDGIAASFSQWGLSTPPSAYYQQSNVVLSSPSGTGLNVNKIALQQYIAAYPDGLRGWNIWRRTGVPSLSPAPDALSARAIPRRYTYGQTSYASNTTAVQNASTAIGGDTQDTKVWWDK